MDCRRSPRRDPRSPSRRNLVPSSWPFTLIRGLVIAAFAIALTSCEPLLPAWESTQGPIDWPDEGQTADDAIVQVEISTEVFAIAHDTIVTTRPEAGALVTDPLASVLLQHGAGGLDARSLVETDAPPPNITNSCPYPGAWSLENAVSCRDLANVVLSNALPSAEQLRVSVDQQILARHGDMSDDDLAFLSSWGGQAVTSGLNVASIRAEGWMRDAGICDTKLNPEDEAFRHGEEQGRLLYAQTAEAMLPTVSKSVCNTDVIASSVLAEARVNAEYEPGVCVGYEPKNVFEVNDLENLESERRNGLVKGISDAHELLRADLVGSWECDPEPPPEPEPTAEPETCECWSRHSGSGPVYCFPRGTFPPGEPNRGSDLVDKSYETPMCRPGLPRDTPKPLGSPVVFDLDGDGIQLSRSETVSFDLRADGEPVRISALTGDDAFLAMDRNGDGRIESGNELFGNATKCKKSKCADGIEALSMLDDNGDGVLNKKDPAFSKLRLWKDDDRDGVGTDKELSELSKHKIVSVSVEGTTARAWTDGYGNAALRSVTFGRSDGSDGVAHDVWFVLWFAGPTVTHADSPSGADKPAH